MTEAADRAPNAPRSIELTLGLVGVAAVVIGVVGWLIRSRRRP